MQTILKAKLFHCPHCGMHTKHEWYNVAKGHLHENGVGYCESFLKDLLLSSCGKCKRYALWLNDRMVYPVSSIAWLPTENMPFHVKEDFTEGRNVVNMSPRAAAALLRLALQKLIIYLGEGGKNLDRAVANLVKKGLPEKIYETLYAVRVIGKNAVEPGKINSEDNTYSAITLFELVNTIVEVMISQPKKVNKLYGALPTRRRSIKKKRRKRKRKVAKARLKYGVGNTFFFGVKPVSS